MMSSTERLKSLANKRGKCQHTGTLRWASWFHWLCASQRKTSKQRLHAHNEFWTLLWRRGTIPRGTCTDAYSLPMSSTLGILLRTAGFNIYLRVLWASGHGEGSQNAFLPAVPVRRTYGEPTENVTRKTAQKSCLGHCWEFSPLTQKQWPF